MNELELQAVAMDDAVTVKVKATEEMGLIVGWNDVEGFAVDVDLPPCKECGHVKHRTQRFKFEDLEVVEVSEG